MLTTPLPAWVLVLGKLLGAMAYLLLVIVAGLPLISLSYLLGGVGPDEVAVAVTLLLVTTLTYGLVGLWLSAHLRGTVASTALAYAAIVLPLALIPVLIGLVAAILGPLISAGPPAWLIYVFDVIVSLHPFMAGAMTAIALNEGSGLFFYEMDLGRASVTII